MQKKVKELRLSVSMMTTYKGCPMAYFLKYVMHEKVPPLVNAVFGKDVHFKFNDFYTKNFDSAASFANSFKFMWARECSGDALKGKDREGLIVTEYPYTLKNGEKKVLRIGNHIKFPTYEKVGVPEIFWGYMGLGEGIMKDFYNKYIDKPAPIMRENRMELLIEGHPDINGIKKKHKVIVIFDRVDVFRGEDGKLKCMIGDYKTDKADPVKKSFEIHRHPQFSLYSLAFRQLIKDGRLKGIIPDGIEKEDAILYYHLRQRKILPTYRSERDFDYVRSILDDVSDGILNKRFTPFYGFHCKMCDYQVPCEKYSHSFGGPRLDLDGKIQPTEAIDWDADYNRFLKEGPAIRDYTKTPEIQGQLEMFDKPYSQERIEREIAKKEEKKRNRQRRLKFPKIENKNLF